MIQRKIESLIRAAQKKYPVVGIVGPRQSGKTTLARKLFPDYSYVNLERPDERRFAREDPRGFLERYSQQVILDEVQRVPELFSYIQAQVDERKSNGQFVLIGLQHFLMLLQITQTLAGRIGLFYLYPLAYEELVGAGQHAVSLEAQLYKGGYPRLYDQNLLPEEWLPNYIQTYLDRDISLLSQIDNLLAFEKFLRLTAGRTGQLLNLSALGSEVGVSHNTIKAWISLLQTSGVIFLVQPYFVNISKRLNKTPKLYFVDTGLACQLIGIHVEDQLATHPLYGAIFETLVMSEGLKYYANRGMSRELYFWRDQQGLEADVLLEKGLQRELAEVKAAKTVPKEVFGKLPVIKKLLPESVRLNMVYGGDEDQVRGQDRILGWRSLERLWEEEE